MVIWCEIVNNMFPGPAMAATDGRDTCETGSISFPLLFMQIAQRALRFLSKAILSKVTSSPAAQLLGERSNTLPVLDSRWFTTDSPSRVSQYALHHSLELFGPDPLSFRPERWLHKSVGGDEPSWDKIKAIERNNELIFGYGKYSCLGKSIAFLELNKVFVELLRRFEFKLVDPENPWSRTCYGIHLIRGLWVTVRERTRPANLTPV